MAAGEGASTVSAAFRTQPGQPPRAVAGTLAAGAG
jgi:hypothetical protein